jgi:hypothetical protein
LAHEFFQDTSGFQQPYRNGCIRQLSADAFVRLNGSNAAVRADV